MKFKTIDDLPADNIDLPNKIIPFIMFFVKQMKWQFSVIFILFAISNALISIVPYYIGEIVGAFESFDPETQKQWDVFFPLISIFIIVCFVFQPIIVQIGVYIQAKTLSVFANLMRRQMILYVLEHSYEYFQTDFSGRISGKLIEMPSAVREVVHTCIGAFLFAVISFIVSLVLFATVSIEFFIISSVWLVLYAVLMVYFVPKLRDLSESWSVERSHLRGRTVDVISNILTMKLFSNIKHDDGYLKEKLQSTTDTFVKSDLKMWHLWMWLEALSTIFWIAVVGYSFWGWSKNTISTGQVAMILPLTLQVTNVSWWMSEIFTGFFQKIGEIQEGIGTIVKPHGLVDDKNAKLLNISKGCISINEMDFSYDNKNVFKNFNLEISGGQKIGLVGRSGAGKSSLVQLLLRLYDIKSGQISIDGQDISKVTQDSLRSNIALIPQDTSLFHRSLMDNIRYGRLNATDEEVFEAAKKAYAHDFITDLPDGYETLVGERGVKLSGGQRQRIAIARAILKDAPILILDEATSALDSESEKAIQDSLKSLMDGKTVIAIAHRLSTISNLDRLIVMEDGKIIEDGTHEDLISNSNGHYSKLWSMQSGGFLKN